MLFKNNFFYYSAKTQQPVGPVSFEGLRLACESGDLNPTDYVGSPQFGDNPKTGMNTVRYDQLIDFNITVKPDLESFLEERRAQPTTILCGPNNCGKSLLLKLVRAISGETTYLVGCNRFYHVDRIMSREIHDSFAHEHHSQYMQQFFTARQNLENNTLQLEELLAGLTNDRREALFRLCGELLDCKFTLKRVQDNNELSPHYIDMDGDSLSIGSTGTRLLMLLIGICLSGKYSALLIDEPEQGLSPKLQAYLARHLYDASLRETLFPHLKTLFIATHSHLFLDRRKPNNFLVTKQGTEITITPCDTRANLHQLIFTMLGNDLESLSLPSAIVIVEGPADVIYLKHVLQLHLPNNKVTVVGGNGDGNIVPLAESVSTALGDLRTSPYRERVMVVVDATNQVHMGHLNKLGIRDNNIVRWSNNGIEYVYPPSLLADAMDCGATNPAAEISMDKSNVISSARQRSKVDLAKYIIEHMTIQHALPDELQTKVLARLQQMVG